MFFKKKDIELNCYTSRRDIYEYSKIKRTNSFFPEWWKDLPKSDFYHDQMNGPARTPHLTMKSCVGFIELFKHSFTIPMWCDFRVVDMGTNTDRTDIGFADGLTRFETHDALQYGSLADHNIFRHIKIMSPWAIFCNTNIKWAYMPPTWHNVENDRFSFLPAIADFVNQNHSHINMFYRRDQQPSAQQIDFGTPIQYLIPLTERNVKVHCHLVSEQEHSSLLQLSSRRKFLGEYGLRKKIRKPSEKCPF